MKIAIWLALTAAFATASAQDVQEKDLAASTRHYHDYRQQATEPPYALKRVKAIIKAIKPSKGTDGDSQNFISPAWSHMSTPEKFTYCMLHGEVSSQNCDAMPWIVDEEHKVFAYPPPFNSGEENWSDRQHAFLVHHRHEVVELLRSTIRTQGRVGVNLKQTIVELHANEMIPDLIKAYDRDHKDQDILSVLMLLMKDGKFKPFMESITYRKLYGPDANYQSFIVANEANQKLMAQRAMTFYKSRIG